MNLGNTCLQRKDKPRISFPAKTNLQDHARLCKNLARILHARLSWHVHAICPFSCTFLARFLHNLAHILQEMVQDFARVAARIIICISCTFFARSCKNWCKIVQESCKKRDISRARAKQVLHARFLQDSCTILHDLASSFLLGSILPALVQHIKRAVYQGVYCWGKLPLTCPLLYGLVG